LKTISKIYLKKIKVALIVIYPKNHQYLKNQANKKNQLETNQLPKKKLK
jgi:hypothetical protein